MPRAVFAKNKIKTKEDEIKYRSALEKILLSYQKRNSSYTYIQSHCTIGCRLIEICKGDPEPAFWLYAALFEYILPVGYFSQLMHI